MAKKRIKVTDVNYNQEHLVEVEESDLPAPTPTAEQLAEVIEGSETVVVDVSESGNKLEVHLDADVVAKIDNSMQLPVAPPVSTALVGVNHAGSQTMVGVGEGLEIDNGVLKATGGVKLYLHTFTMQDYTTKIVSTRSTQFESPSNIASNYIEVLSILFSNIIPVSITLGTVPKLWYVGVSGLTSLELGNPTLSNYTIEEL